MSEHVRTVRVVPTVTNPQEFCSLLFNLPDQEILQFPKELFDQHWPCARNVYVTQGKLKELKKHRAQYYQCRMRNDKKGYKIVQSENRQRRKSHRIEGDCDVKVSKTLPTSIDVHRSIDLCSDAS